MSILFSSVVVIFHLQRSYENMDNAMFLERENLIFFGLQKAIAIFFQMSVAPPPIRLFGFNDYEILYLTGHLCISWVLHVYIHT